MIQKEKKFLEFRALFPAYSQGVYMNHAAVSPFSTLTRDALMTYWERRANLPVDVYPGIVDELKEFKQMIARLINSKSDEHIAFIPNTSTGLSMITSGLTWQAGDRIILNTLEFPANIYPFLNMQRFGVKTDWVEPEDGRISVAAIKKKITRETRMIAISFVQFLNGFQADLAAIGQICQERGIWFVVDGIQGVGVIPLDVQKCHIHALSTAGHKWMMWPMGAGFLYIHPQLDEKLHPAHAGWLSVKDSWNLFDYRLDFLDSASKFQPGTLNVLGLLPARDMLAKFLELTVEDIYSRIVDITSRLLDGLKNLPVKIITPQEKECRSGIVSIQIPDPLVILKKLETQGIYIAVREGIMRFSPHCTNTPGDVEYVIETLKKIF